MSDQTSSAYNVPAITGEMHITPEFVALVAEEAARRGFATFDPVVAGYLVTVFLEHVFTSPAAPAVIERHFGEALALYETAEMLADADDHAPALTRPVRRNALH
jgi:hypothetical protein